MTIEITDNRQEWLIGLGEKLATAIQEEERCECEYRVATDRRRKIEDEIRRIGGYILEARDKAMQDSCSDLPPVGLI